MAMTDAEIENLIMDVIRQRGITWDDMVGGPSLRFDRRKSNKKEGSK